jgi:ABC-type transport system involved in cytochrome bd biosynthesis fused ATPase/permease subunit
MNKIQQLQNDIDELRSRTRKAALMPVAVSMFIIGFSLSFVEAHLGLTMVTIIGFTAFVISTSLYKLIMDRHPANAQRRVLTRELLDD